MVMTTKIKTFEDLRFKEGIKQINIAFLTLDNGYKINVQHHKDYSSGRVYYIGISRFGMCISEHRYQTKEEVNSIIKDTQNWLPLAGKSNKNHLSNSTWANDPSSIVTDATVEKQEEKNVTKPDDRIHPKGYEGYGLTKREELAKTFMSSLINISQEVLSNGFNLNHKYLANEAVEAADALIAALNK